MSYYSTSDTYSIYVFPIYADIPGMFIVAMYIHLESSVSVLSRL